MMSPTEFQSIFRKLIQKSDNLMSIFMWGPPGIGKSSIVHQVAREFDLPVVDVRLSQLAPTDLRGLPKITPLPNGDEVMNWIAPNFLPRNPDSKGILFVDEFNMCSGSMMGIAQQLVLDRRVGDYSLPRGWTIVGAGNRSTDRAAVSVMPAPVANRFIHFHISPSLDDFKQYAYSAFPQRGISLETVSKVLGFLNFRPNLLNIDKISQSDISFPTPRSWENAMRLIDLDLDASPAIGEATNSQLRAYLRLFSSLPNIPLILSKGHSSNQTLKKSDDPSILYAIVSSLLSQSSTISHYMNSLDWMLHIPTITQDYVGLFISEAMLRIKSDPSLNLPDFAQQLVSNPTTADFVVQYRDILSSFNA